MTAKAIIKKEWLPLRVDVTVDDTPITTFNRDNAVYEAGKVTFDFDINSIAIVAYGEDTADEIINYKLWGRRRNTGPIEAIAAGVMTLGAQVVTKDPITGKVVTAFWVDTITNTIVWIKTGTIVNSASDGICYLLIDGYGLQDVYLEIDIPDASQMASFSAMITGVVT